MRGKIFLLLTFILFSCQTLPVINPPVSFVDQKTFACAAPFLKEQYRLVHAIEVRLPGNTRSSVIGITLLDPRTRSLSCAIMTAEGMVLFEAESSPDRLSVKRALPPFDSSGFAANMINDIKLIFFIPEGKIQNKGYLPDSEKVCRYKGENEDWIDVTESKTKGVEIKSYSATGSLKRTVRFDRTAGKLHRRIELMADETFAYSLVMTLIEAQPVKK